MTWTAADLFGYLACALVVVSLVVSSPGLRRPIWIAGTSLFVVYGILIHSVPIAIAGAAVTLHHVAQLRRAVPIRTDLGLLEVQPESPFLTDFLRSHRDDIARTQPEFGSAHLSSYSLVLTRDGLPAGAFIGRQVGTDLRLELDYVLHTHRDSRLGHWLYAGGGLYGQGFRRVIARPTTDVHRAYLLRMGFRDEGDQLIRELH